MNYYLGEEERIKEQGGEGEEKSRREKETGKESGTEKLNSTKLKLLQCPRLSTEPHPLKD